MWVELHLQGLELGLDQVLLKFGCVQFAFAVLAVIMQSLADCYDHPVDEQIVVPGLDQEHLEGIAKMGSQLPGSQTGPKDHVQHGKSRAAQGVYRQTSAPLAWIKSKTASQGADRDRQQSEHIPITKRVADRFSPGDLVTRFSTRNVVRTGK